MKTSKTTYSLYETNLPLSGAVFDSATVLSEQQSKAQIAAIVRARLAWFRRFHLSQISNKT